MRTVQVQSILRIWSFLWRISGSKQNPCNNSDRNLYVRDSVTFLLENMSCLSWVDGIQSKKLHSSCSENNWAVIYENVPPGHRRAEEALIRLRICAIWSGLLLSAHRIFGCCRIYRCITKAIRIVPPHQPRWLISIRKVLIGPKKTFIHSIAQFESRQMGT